MRKKIMLGELRAYLKSPADKSEPIRKVAKEMGLNPRAKYCTVGKVFAARFIHLAMFSPNPKFAIELFNRLDGKVPEDRTAEGSAEEQATAVRGFLTAMAMGGGPAA